jgi:hypothetical protein
MVRVPYRVDGGHDVTEDPDPALHESEPQAAPGTHRRQPRDRLDEPAQGLHRRCRGDVNDLRIRHEAPATLDEDVRTTGESRRVRS